MPWLGKPKAAQVPVSAFTTTPNPNPFASSNNGTPTSAFRNSNISGYLEGSSSRTNNKTSKPFVSSVPEHVRSNNWRAQTNSDSKHNGSRDYSPVNQMDNTSANSRGGNRRGDGNNSRGQGRRGGNNRGVDGARGGSNRYRGNQNKPAAVSNDTENDTTANGQNEVTELKSMPSAHNRLERFATNSNDHVSYGQLVALRKKERSDGIANGTIDDPDKPKRLSEAITFIGTCPDMCPLFEREQRSVQNAVDKLEMGANGRIDKNKAVKRFQRPAAGIEAPLPSDVRPPKVLISTLEYLIKKVAGGGQPLIKVHRFLWDRTRAIRQDFTLQNYRGEEAIFCHEVIARMHILCLHQLCEEDPTMFVAQQEMEQLQKVLTTLNELYEAFPNSPYQSEFRAYQLLVHIRNPDLERQVHLWPRHVFDSPVVQTALKLSHLLQRNNEPGQYFGNAESCQNFFGVFFSMMRNENVTYLMACVLETHFPQIRKTALRAMRTHCRIYSTKHYFLTDVAELLHYEDEELTKAECMELGFPVDVAENRKGLVVLFDPKQTVFNERGTLKQTFHHRLVESKRRDMNFPDIIYGKCPKKSKSQKLDTVAKQVTDISTLASSMPPAQALARPPSAFAPPLSQEPLSAPTPPSTSILPKSFPKPQNVGELSLASAPPLPDGPSGSSAPPPAPFPKSFPKSFSLASAPPLPDGPEDISADSTPAICLATGPTAVWPTIPQQGFPFTNGVTQPTRNPFQNPAVKKSPFSATLSPFGRAGRAAMNTNPPVNAFQSAIHSQAPAPIHSIPTIPNTNFSNTSLGNEFSIPSLTQASKTTPQTGGAAGTFSPTENNESTQATTALFPSSQVSTTALPQSVFVSSTTENSVPKATSSLFPSASIPPTSVFQQNAGIANNNVPSSASVFNQNSAASTKLPSNYFSQTSKGVPSEETESSIPERKTSSWFQKAPAGGNNSSVPNPVSVFDQNRAPPPTFSSNFFSQPPINAPPQDTEGAPVPERKTSSWFQKAPVEGTNSNVPNPVSVFDQNRAPPPTFSSNFFSQPPAEAKKPVPGDSVSNWFPQTTTAEPAAVTTGPSLFRTNTTTSDTQISTPTSVTNEYSAKDAEAQPLFSDSIIEGSSDSLVERAGSPEAANLACQLGGSGEKRKKEEEMAISKKKKKKMDHAEELDEERGIAKCAVLEEIATRVKTKRLGKFWNSWHQEARKRLYKRIGEENRAKPVAYEQPQWRPVQYPVDDPAMEGSWNEVQKFTKVNFETVPLRDIFMSKVEVAFLRTKNEEERRWRLLISNSNEEDTGDYWWTNKFLGNAGELVAQAESGTFIAQTKLNSAAEAREVGGFVYGCSASWAVSNTERFRLDRARLHAAVNYLSANSRFEKLALTVVCYRSPLDEENAHPCGQDKARNSLTGRQSRLKAIHEALDLGALGDKVVGRDIILVETLRDCNFTPAMKRLASLVATTVDHVIAARLASPPQPPPTKRRRAQTEVRLPPPRPISPPTANGNRSEEEPDRKKPKSMWARYPKMGMATDYFNLKARGLHLNWDKFPAPGVPATTPGEREKPVVKEAYLVRAGSAPRPKSAMALLTEELLEMEREAREVNRSLDEGLEDMGELMRMYAESGMDSA